MKKRVTGIIIALCAGLCACHSTPQESSTAANIQPETTAEPMAVDAESDVQEAPQIDLSKLPEDAVTAYTQGSMAFTMSDILPILSSSSGYSQKWEFYFYTRPYEVRLKFEISNFAFSKNEGKVKGHVKKYDGATMVSESKISKTLKNGEWSATKDVLSLTFGDYKLTWEGDHFRIKGVFDEGDFDFEVPPNFWKPGTGNVYFGNSKENVFKYSVLTYHKPVTRGIVTVNGKAAAVEGQAYGNHYATTVAVYDMFDEVADSRKRTDDLLVEFRYYVPSAKYNAPPFGFMFVGFEGEPVFGTTEIERTSLETWLDEANYGYEISSRQRIDGRNGDDTASLIMKTANPEPSDPYADLPAFQRNIASRFSKPIEYSIPIDWELDLDVDGIKATIPLSGSYSLTRLR